MKVIVCGERSGRVRDAFLRLNHDAASCDLFPSDAPGPHFQCDMWDSRITRQHWDVAIIHPMCTYLCNSGVRWLYEHPWRWDLMRAGAHFFKACLDHFPAARVAVENPIMHGHALKIIGRECDQVVQPHHFGDPFFKATCWWLNGLPNLEKTDALEVPTDPAERRKWAAVHQASPGPERARIRSTFYPGMSAAIAAQWGAVP